MKTLKELKVLNNKYAPKERSYILGSTKKYLLDNFVVDIIDMN